MAHSRNHCVRAEARIITYSECMSEAFLVAATKEIGLEVNADKTKYMVMSREQTAGLVVTL